MEGWNIESNGREPFHTSSSRLYEWIRLGKVFTARNLERVTGTRIIWTDSLADHLWLVDSDEDEVAANIFHHASFLMMQSEK
jgi:hypothetical protein